MPALDFRQGRSNGRNTSLNRPSRVPRLRLSTIRFAGQDGKNSPQDKDGPGKADFSAYWSLKIREFFDSRKRTIEDMERKGMPEPEIVRKFVKKAEDQMSELRQLEEEESQLKAMKIRARLELDAEKFKEAAKKEGIVPMRPEEMEAAVEKDIENARAGLRSAAVTGIAMNIHRSRELIRAVLLFPITFSQAVHRHWSSLYDSQRYENFLMAEGERIWYWRNRSENERWFWEIAFWDKLAFPVLCTIAYEFLVPNHFMWAIVVPCTFILIQSGELPSPRGLEFWTLAYFGFYQKCWPEIFVWLRSSLAVFGLA